MWGAVHESTRATATIAGAMSLLRVSTDFRVCHHCARIAREVRGQCQEAANNPRLAALTVSLFHRDTRSLKRIEGKATSRLPSCADSQRLARLVRATRTNDAKE